jgi:beta-aspartyl-peptidase (threonine type)
VALDRDGNLAAGTSTGGMTNKQWGRVGDSPIIGAGTYADNRSCAVSATGHGEYFIRATVARDICARVQYSDASLAEAADQVVRQQLSAMGGDGGVIALDPQGNIALTFNTSGMYRASIDTRGEVYVAIYGDE